MRLVLTSISLLAVWTGLPQPAWGGSARAAPQRIVSMAPSITETLFEMGLGDRVVGVTRYCKYPPEADALPEIGGYTTPNYEALASLRPDLAVLLPEHAEIRPQFEALGIEVLNIDSRSVRAILDGFRIIGERCGAETQAEQLVSELNDLIARVSRIRSNRRSPRVLLSLGGNGDRSALRETHAAAPGSIYHDLLRLAGGDNVLPPGPLPYPTLSAEGLLRLDPEVVVDFATNERDVQRVREGWGRLTSLRAVQNSRVVVFNQDFMAVPGPRLVRFIGELARAIDPEAPWAD